jgi:ABC-type amino acid transport substrate-binding protein
MNKSILRITSGFLLLFGLSLLLIPSAGRLLAQDAQNQQTIKVATKEIEPFVFVDGQEVSGFSVDLWQALATELDIQYEFDIVNTVQEQLDAVEQDKADAAIAAISITADREKIIDFSHRYFESGLGILMHSGGSTPMLDTFRLAFSPALLRLFVFLVLTIVIADHIIWLIERRRNEEFPQTYLRGVSEGIWWAAVTVTTVGYGDRTPIGRLGRLFGIFWMFAGLFIIASFTAGVTSQLTLQTLQGTINGPEDLPSKRIVTVAGSTSDEWLEIEGIGHRTVPTIEEAYALLESDTVQAVVYDHPVLLYYALQNEDKGLIVPGEPFNKEDYGIAFPTGSPLREEINRALLVLVENGTYDRIAHKWFGSGSGY